jgi:hypothetical protein
MSRIVIVTDLQNYMMITCCYTGTKYNNHHFNIVKTFLAAGIQLVALIIPKCHGTL